jgi:beta-galactosidase
MEDKYPTDHELYPERVILGSENYPKQIGKRWPMVESTDYVIGDFTWTAWDYIGEAGIGKTLFVEEGDPRLKIGPFALMSHTSGFPWRLANDADFDINGNVLAQGCYRSVVWGSDATHVFSYHPDHFGKKEIVSMWGFTDVTRSWNFEGYEGKKLNLVVFSNADEVELFVNDRSVGRKKAGEAPAVEDLPRSFVFEAVYEPGRAEAVSYKDGREISRDAIKTTGSVSAIRLSPEKEAVSADGHSLVYIPVELVDAEGNVVPDGDVRLTAEVTGGAELLGFGSGNPVTAENYTAGVFTTYRGRAMAVLRSGYEAGEAVLRVTAGEGGPEASCRISVL